MLDRPACLPQSLRFGIALAAVLLLLGAATPASASCAVTDLDCIGTPPADPAPVQAVCDTPPTSGECWDAWNDNDANSSCQTPQIYVVGNDCVVSAICDVPATRFVPSTYDMASITTCVTEISDLINCNGQFQVGGTCS